MLMDHEITAVFLVKVRMKIMARTRQSTFEKDLEPTQRSMKIIHGWLQAGNHRPLALRCTNHPCPAAHGGAARAGMTRLAW